MIKFIILKLLFIFDSIHQYKIFNFLRIKKIQNLDVLLDVGAHHGESIVTFMKYFNVKRIYSFEPSPINFQILEKKVSLIKKKNSFVEIIIENLCLGDETKDIILKQTNESSSSTLNNININSKYLKRKKKLLYEGDDNFYKEIKVKMITLDEYLSNHKINKIDFIKIDTEGYEFNVLRGLESKINKIGLIMFEHHYHDMLEKNYKFSDINNILIKNNFMKIYKAKIPFRKTFEYIYENKNFL